MCSSIIYRNITDFWIFILYPVISPIVHELFLKFLGKFYIVIFKKGQFSLFFPDLHHFSCLFELSRTSGAMLNKSSESTHLCFFPGFLICSSNVSLVTHWNIFMMVALENLSHNSNTSAILACVLATLIFSWFLVWQVISSWILNIWGIMLKNSGSCLNLF